MSAELIHLLIIEDSEDDALLLLRELRRGGFQVVGQRVETAHDLRSAITQKSWDAVVSDYRLPSFDATAALEIINQSQLDLPFIVVSGTIGDASAVELMKSGAHDYLLKGNLTRLPEALRREMREARIRAERKHTNLELDRTKERLRLAIEGAGIGTWDWDMPSGELVVNERWANLLGHSLAELSPVTFETWRSRVHPDDWSEVEASLDQHIRGDSPTFNCEFRMSHCSGQWRWFASRGKAVEWGPEGQPQRMTGTHSDITERKQAKLRLEMQNAILERIARSDPLPDILDALVRATEPQLDGGLCSILLCDMKTTPTGDRTGYLRHGAAPNLPQAYCEAVDGAEIGASAGSCGTAAFCRDIVIVSDIASDPLWNNFKHLALEHGLRACWSAPALGSDGEVLATFAVYYRTCKTPQPREIDIISLAANIAKIAIERDRATESLERLNRELEERVERRTADLRESESKLDSILNFAPEVVYVKDLQGRHIFVNQAFLDLFGCTKDDVLGKTNQEFYPSDMANQFDTNDQVVLASGRFHQCEETLKIGDRAHTFLSNKFVLLDRNGSAYALCGISTDISDRRQYQDALQRSEERTRATLQAIPDLVFRLDHEYRYVDLMPSDQVEMLIEPNEALGKRLSEVLPPAIAAAQQDAAQRALATQTVQSFVQEIVVNGDLRYEDVRVAPCGENEVVFLVRDISERKAIEAKLQQTIHELARATRLKDEFLANMSHELRTPLNAILGMSEGLQEAAFGALNSSQLKAIATIEKSGKHLLELISDILDLSKIEAGKLELSPEEVSIRDLCDASLSFVRQMAHKKQIALSIDIADRLESCDIYVDNRRMRQILINLLSNAVKFTHSGGAVNLAVYLEPQVSDACSPTPLLQTVAEAPASTGYTFHPSANALSPHELLDSTVCFSITDTGIGIAPEDMGKLFQSFVQIDSSLSRQHAGTGLGLALVKKITELHGGSVSVTSTLHQGSCFTVCLPYAQPPANKLELCQCSDTLNYKETVRGGPCRQPLILLAEDNEANVMTISAYLKAKGYRLRVVSNGYDAIATAQSHPPDIILMDMQMPQLDGLAATRRIRLIPHLETIPIIALTAFAMTDDREKCLAAGVSDYVTKPVKLRQLVSLIQQRLAATSP